MIWQPGQTKYVAEMTQDEIDAHNYPIMEKLNKCKVFDETFFKTYDTLFFNPEELNAHKGAEGLKSVIKQCDYSPAILAYGEDWLIEEYAFLYEYKDVNFGEMRRLIAYKSRVNDFDPNVHKASMVGVTIND